jgi:hypothetical protein
MSVITISTNNIKCIKPYFFVTHKSKHCTTIAERPCAERQWKLLLSLCLQRQAYSDHSPQDSPVRRNRKPDGPGVSMCESNHSGGSKVDAKLTVTSFRLPHTTHSSRCQFGLIYLSFCESHFDQCPMPVWKVTNNHTPNMVCWQKICRA